MFPTSNEKDIKENVKILTCFDKAKSLEISGLFAEKADKPAIFFAAIKKVLTTEVQSLTILIENTKTP